MSLRGRRLAAGVAAGCEICRFAAEHGWWGRSPGPTGSDISNHACAAYRQAAPGVRYTGPASPTTFEGYRPSPRRLGVAHGAS